VKQGKQADTQGTPRVARPASGAPGGDPRAFDRLPALLAKAGIPADAEALRIMRAHFDLLLKWNQRVNLTSVRDPSEIVVRHFLESAYLVKALALGGGLLYDVGSGAGFPGLPAKALCREVKLVMVESNLKKAAFLKEAIREARVEGASVERGRVESLLERREVELADWITMRAVGDLEAMLHVFRHLLLVHGYLALFLGEEDAARVARSEPGFTWREPMAIPGSERRVILVGQNLAGA
jgi:16S rRNA (guanine527-N7)-methyltransferase